VEDILITPRGPIISDIMDVDIGITSKKFIAMQATWMHPQKLDGLFRLHHVKDFKSFRKAASGARIISQNMVYADTEDNIGWQYTSDVPQRGKGWGILPLPGWDNVFNWVTPSTPWEDMPYLYNPEFGFAATANNKPTVGDGGIYLGRDWIEYRHARIIETLSKRDDWDLASTQQMQLDKHTIPWQEMKSNILSTPVKTEEARLAIEFLQDWDGVLDANSAGAAVYEYFVISMLMRLARSKAPKSAEYALDKGFHPMVLRSFFTVRSVSNLIRKIKTEPEGWFEEGWSTEKGKALTEAVQKLRFQLGGDPAAWAWGSVHNLVLTHPMGTRPPLDKIFNRGPYPMGGDHDTIAQAGRLPDKFGSNVTGLANLRAIHDIGNWDESRFVLAGGQSGNPLSPHYDDLLNIWLKGKTVSIAWTEDAVVRTTRRKLRLVPKE